MISAPRLLLSGVLICASTLACAPAASPQVLHPEFRYTASYAHGPVGPGEPLHVVWTAERFRTSSTELYDIRLCVGVFGSFESAESLKRSSPSAARADCPPAGALVASETMRARSDVASAFELDLVLPRELGFYDVRQIVISGDDRAHNATSAGGIIEIRTR